MAAAIDFIGNTIRFPTIKGNFAMMSPAGPPSPRQSGNVSPQTIWKFNGGTTPPPADPEDQLHQCD